MQSALDAAARPVLRFSTRHRFFILATAAVALVPFWPALAALYDVWNLRPEFSHGVLIPPLAAYLVWRERAWLASTPFQGSWTGMLLITLGVLLWIVGELSTIYVIVQYSFLFVFYGLVLLLVGWPVFRKLWMPLLILLFMIPLPAFFSNNLSLQLQLVSSQLGVLLVRLAGISVLVEGNVIDLGTYRLQVAEACDGLRYLFPLMTLAFVVAYFYRAPFWKRAIVFISSIPVTVMMNSLRIGVIGITVEHWGTSMAEGLLHEFQGWMVFMLSLAVVLGIAWLLNRFGRSRLPWRDAFAFDAPAATVVAGPPIERPLSRSFVAGAVAVVAIAAAGWLLPERTEATPARSSFVEFPVQIDSWSGRRGSIERVYLDALQLDDYLMNDYARRSGNPINLYVAYYGSQRKGQSAHSPRSCLPGGGWQMREFGQRILPFTLRDGTAMRVNRALIELGSSRQIVYYWFQQRGRIITNEYLVKWYIFWDALTRNRSDGALVRITAPLLPRQDPAEVDQELSDFAAAALARIPGYIPD